MKNKVMHVASLFFVFLSIAEADVLPQDLVQNLGADQFAKRELAQAGLVEWSLQRPDEAAKELLFLSQRDDDPEVRKRSFEILRSLANADYLSTGQGYIGILMQEEILEADAGGKARAGIRVLDVMDGSPAEKADLRRGDLILSLDGQGWSEAGAVTLFGDKVAAKKPMIDVVLMVKRGDDAPIAVTVKLGKRPVADLRMAGGDLQLLEDQAKERHFKEWLDKRRVK